MKLKSAANEKALEKLAVDAGVQNRIKRKEKALMDLVSKMPITIKYGCHTIVLKKDDYFPNGFSFHALEENEKGITIKI